jgi:hypothetical protein
MGRKLGLAIAIVAALAAAPAARAATITVDNGGDLGEGCTLRLAIQAAGADLPQGGCSAGSGGDLIVVALGITEISLENPLPSIDHSVGIDGGGGVAIDASDEFRPITIDDPGAVELIDLTVRDGTIESGILAQGGAIYTAGDLVLDRVVMESNAVISESPPNNGATAEGGAVYVAPTGSLRVERSTLRENVASAVSTGPGPTGFPSSQPSGSAIYSQGGPVTIVDSTIEENATTGSSEFNTNAFGAVNATGQTEVRRSTISGNTVTTSGTTDLAFGGGIGIDGSGGSLLITESTIADNSLITEVPRGGGVSVANAPLTVRSSTIAGNSNSDDFGGANVQFNSVGETATFENTIIADPEGTSNCDIGNGTADSLGHNLTDSAGADFDFERCSIGEETTDLTGTDPGFTGLAPNGGPTMTLALSPASPAIDKGVSTGTPTDQRLQPRPRDLTAVANASVGDAADVGAYEYTPITFLALDYDFGAVEPPGFSDTLPLIVRNDTGADVVVSQSEIQGPDAGDFQFGPIGGCDVTLVPDDSCITNVQFAPASGPAGDKDGFFEIGDSVTDDDVQIALSGEVIDLTDPTANLGKLTVNKRKRKAKLRFTASDAVSEVDFRCKLDAKPARPCTSPVTYKRLKRGRHTIQVFPTDAAGNEGDALRKRFRIPKRRG